MKYLNLTLALCFTTSLYSKIQEKTIIDFHPNLITSILEGKKTATVRKRHRKHYREGLDDTSIQGFQNLYKGLKRFYPGFSMSDNVTVVFFNFKK